MSEAIWEGVREADIAACRELLRRGSRSLHEAGRLLPGRVRVPVAAALGFCRAADDAIGAAASPQDGLARLRARLDGIYGGRTEDQPVDRAFAAVVRRYRVPRAIPETLCEGFFWAADGRRYGTIAELRAYAARVASTVGMLLTLLFEQRRPHVLARACDLGIAMQLTSIAGDVGADARAGRLYLPLEWLREIGIDADSFLRAPRFTPKLAVVVERLLCEVDDLYARADPGIPWLPADCRSAVRAARLIYGDIGRLIRLRNHDTVSRRADPSRHRMLRLLFRAWWGRATRKAEAVGVGVPPLSETAFLVRAVTDEDRGQADAPGAADVAVGTPAPGRGGT
jgi:phytoene synthase